MDFKVGEKVRVKRGFTCTYGVTPDMRELEGKVVTISNIDSDNSIDICGRCETWDEQCFEKIYDKPTKEELRDMPIGTKITTDRKEDNVFVKTEEDSLEFYSVEYNDNLDSGDINNDLSIDCYGTKIIKIEKPTGYETVYKYDRDEIKEMTVSEIEKELGHPVKIIKEGE